MSKEPREQYEDETNFKVKIDVTPYHFTYSGEYVKWLESKLEEAGNQNVAIVNHLVKIGELESKLKETEKENIIVEKQNQRMRVWFERINGTKFNTLREHMNLLESKLKEAEEGNKELKWKSVVDLPKMKYTTGEKYDTVEGSKDVLCFDGDDIWSDTYYPEEGFHESVLMYICLEDIFKPTRQCT